MSYLAKLLAIGSPSIGAGVSGSVLQEELQPLYVSKNGFYAFQSALLVRHLGEPSSPLNLTAWNAAETWRSVFNRGPAGVCFAENVFGEQFVLQGGGVWHFDPETSETTRLAATLEEWAELILDDYAYRTGHSLAKDWQTRFGPLPRGTKLVPRRPFVIGGEFEVSNLKAEDEIAAMRIRAAIANQIRDLPDGSPVEIRLVD